ncbi:3-oxoacyl-ACP synthase, partial [Paenibacillus sepulcri]|nr:3-oxoacyl-ACP synthase [Paenibacillus sepulcri]
LRALNPQPASPFASRFGLSLGEGAAFVVLEPLDMAILRGATIYAEICGYGLSNDAYHETTPDPEGKGIQIAVNMALANSGIDPSAIGYINAHGTGTQANDHAEISGLRAAFGDKLGEIPLSSSKAYFGHNLGAAAAIEFTTSLYAIHHHLLPAALHYDKPRPGCEDIRIVANDMMAGRPDYLLNNNSAFGGHNAAIVAKTRYSENEPKRIETDRHLRRIAVVGIGAVIGDGADGRAGASSFQLKDFDKGLYERRMNRLSQFSIGAVSLALDDAGWSREAAAGQDTGFIYGTSRGSTESIGKFLGSVFGSGPELASSIYFPHTVINSISGKTAEKMKLKGFSSSLSTGGTEGLMALIYGCGILRDGVHDRLLVAAGDEFSELSDKIDRAKGLAESRFHMTEGSVCLALCDL